MLVFVRDLRVIYKIVLCGSLDFGEALVRTQSCLCVCTFHKMDAALPGCQVLSYLT